MTCASAVEHVLRAAGRPMTAQDIADEINSGALYRRGDGRPLPPYQVSSVAHSSHRFVVEEGRIGLRTDGPSSPPTPRAMHDEGRHSQRDPTAILIGCVSRKETEPRPARDLYRTELFRRRRAYAERSGRPWLIVSALHGLLEPEEVVEPYDRALSDLSAEERHRLSEQIAAELEGRFGPLEGLAFEVHAGDEYMRMLGLGLRARGARLDNPLRGMRIGEQLQWYARHAAGAGEDGHSERPASTSPAIPTGTPTPGLARQITEAFLEGRIELEDRTEAPAAGWAGMPECVVADRLRRAGAGDSEVRLLLTLTAAMDRARDADRLWFAAKELFGAAPWCL